MDQADFDHIQHVSVQGTTIPPKSHESTSTRDFNQLWPFIISLGESGPPPVIGVVRMDAGKTDSSSLGFSNQAWSRLERSPESSVALLAKT